MHQWYSDGSNFTTGFLILDDLLGVADSNCDGGCMVKLGSLGATGEDSGVMNVSASSATGDTGPSSGV